MKKVPHYAGLGLAGIGAVVALNWGTRVETAYVEPVLSTVSTRPETVQLFSAFGSESEPHRFAGPDQPNSSPGMKLPPKKPQKAQPAIKDPVKSTKPSPKKQPAVVAASGHIL
jgi:hypothetical protein